AGAVGFALALGLLRRRGIEFRAAGRNLGCFVCLSSRFECRRGLFGHRRVRAGLGGLLGYRLAHCRFVSRVLGGFAGSLGVLCCDRIAAHHVAITVRPAVVMAVAAATGAAIGVRIGVALLTCFVFDQRLPVGDGDLVVIRVDFRKRQEAVTVAAIIDERRLQRRLNARDLGEIDVTAKLLAV